jgi:hypothetical protein
MKNWHAVPSIIVCTTKLRADIVVITLLSNFSVFDMITIVRIFIENKNEK